MHYPCNVTLFQLFVSQSLKEMENEKLQVQIQAYLDNVFDVGALLEDAESKGEIIENLTELQDINEQVNYTLWTQTHVHIIIYCIVHMPHVAGRLFCSS